MTSWSFTVPGQPVTMDSAYQTGKMPLRRGGKPVVDDEGRPRVVHRPFLTAQARSWRDDVQLLAQTAKPSRWKPKGQLRVTLDLRLAHDIDADNVLKLILDGLAMAIDYNDSHFLPCVASKTSGRKPYDACVIVTVEDVL